MPHAKFSSGIVLAASFLLFDCALGDSYTVTIREVDPRIVHVDAVLANRGGRLTMDWESASHLRDGWATFLFGLEVTGPDGQEVAFEPEHRASWRLADAGPDTLHVGYDIRIGHDYVRWPDGGHNEAVYVLDRSLFFAGRAVFVATSSDLAAPGYSDLQIEFVVPDHWQVTTTWAPVSSHPRRYVAQGLRDLTEIGIFVGEQEQRRITVDGVETLLSAADDYPEALDLIERTLRPVVPGAVALFGGTAGERFALIVNDAPRTVIEPYFGGGVLGRTMSLSTAGLPQGPLVPMLNHIITHEFLHLWIGIGISPAEIEREYWLTEGFTEYTTLKLMHGLGLIDEESILRAPMSGLEDDVRKYLPVAGSISMREAGFDKSANYDLIYSGGALVAFALDIEIREGSGLRAGLEDLLQRMYGEFNSDPFAADRAAFTYDDVVRISGELAGTSLEPFFDDYVRGVRTIPLDDYLGRVGLRIESTDGGEVALRSVERLNGKQRRLRAAVLGSSAE